MSRLSNGGSGLSPTETSVSRASPATRAASTAAAAPESSRRAPDTAGAAATVAVRTTAATARPAEPHGGSKTSLLAYPPCCRNRRPPLRAAVLELQSAPGVWQWHDHQVAPPNLDLKTGPVPGAGETLIDTVVCVPGGCPHRLERSRALRTHVAAEPGVGLRRTDFMAWNLEHDRGASWSVAVADIAEGTRVGRDLRRLPRPVDEALVGVISRRPKPRGRTPWTRSGFWD